MSLTKFLTIIILVLIGINIYIVLDYYSYKEKQKQYINILLHELEETNTFKVNFSCGIENSGYKLTNILLKDSLNSIFPLDSLCKQSSKTLLICRFSELNCESCVNFAIKSILQNIDSIGKENVLFMGEFKNNKLFNKRKVAYGIDNLMVFNSNNLKIPAESLGYPYYFIVDSSRIIHNMFIPDKGTPHISSRYLNLIQKRYFQQVDSISDK